VSRFCDVFGAGDGLLGVLDPPINGAGRDAQALRFGLWSGLAGHDAGDGVSALAIGVLHGQDLTRSRSGRPGGAAASPARARRPVSEVPLSCPRGPSRASPGGRAAARAPGRLWRAPPGAPRVWRSWPRAPRSWAGWGRTWGTPLLE